MDYTNINDPLASEPSLDETNNTYFQWLWECIADSVSHALTNQEPTTQLNIDWFKKKIFGISVNSILIENSPCDNGEKVLKKTNFILLA